MICEERHHLLGEIPTHMSLAEACFWFSVNNLLTIGYGAVVSSIPLFFRRALSSITPVYLSDQPSCHMMHVLF